MCIGLVLSYITPVAAQVDDLIRNHTIVSIDKAGCNSWSQSPIVAAKVKSLLFDYRDNTVTSALYNEGDYLSIVEFRTNSFQRDMTTYATSKENLSYIEKSPSYIRRLISNQWRDIVIKNQPLDEGFSLVSVAKPYSLMAAKSDDKLTNRTFLILVTDHHYNGNDFYDEIVAFMGLNNYELNKEKIFEKCYQVEQEYYIKYLKTIDIHTTDRREPDGYVELYEFLPLQQHISLISILNYPPTIKARKISGGRYQYTVEINERDNDRFRTKRIDIANKPTNDLDDIAWVTYHEGEEVVCTFTLPAGERPHSLLVRAWVNLQDEFYNATVLTPSKSASSHLGRDGLNISIPIEYEPDAKIIFDRFSLPDMFVGDDLQNSDQYTVANRVNLIVLILIICLLVYLYNRFKTFEPTAKNTTIKRL